MVEILASELADVEYARVAGVLNRLAQRGQDVPASSESRKEATA